MPRVSLVSDSSLPACGYHSSSASFPAAYAYYNQQTLHNTAEALSAVNNYIYRQHVGTGRWVG